MDLLLFLPGVTRGNAKPPIVAALFRYGQEKLEKRAEIDLFFVPPRTAVSRAAAGHNLAAEFYLRACGE